MTATEQICLFVNNFNRLTFMRELVRWFDDVPQVKVIILDNRSTYEPLLDWYKTCPYEVRRLPTNLGHQAPWLSGAVGQVKGPYYMVSDPDLSLEGVPKDLMDVLMLGFERYPTRNKVGVSIEHMDIPDGFPLKQINESVESAYWTQPLDDMFFDAPVDTTLALYRTGVDLLFGTKTDNCLRTNRPYTARHMPWYFTPETMTEEENYYMSKARMRSSSTSRLLSLHRMAKR